LLDVIPGGGGAKKGVTNAIGTLSKLDKVDEIVPILKSVFKIADDKVDDFAKEIATISDEKSLGTLLQPYFKNVEETVSVTDDYTRAREYAKQQAQVQKQARQAEQPSILDKAKGLFSNIKRDLIDKFAPVEDVVQKELKSAGLLDKPEYDITGQLDRVLRASDQIAPAFMTEKGFDKVVQAVPKERADEFSQYLIARHAIDLDTRGITTGRNTAEDANLVKALNPEYEQLAQAVTKYSQDILDKSVEYGLVPKELADRLKKIYPNYVPFNRVFNEIEREGSIFKTSGAVGSISDQSIVKAIEGSTREVEDPIVSLFNKTRDVFVQGEKNKTAGVVANLSKLEGNPLDIKLVKNTGDVASDKGSISLFRDGVKEIYEVPRDWERALKQLDVEQLNILNRVLNFPVRVAKAGITGAFAPAFAITNPIRDYFTAITLSERATQTIANPFNFIGSLLSVVKKDDLFTEFMRNAGGGSSFDLLRDNIPATVDAVRSQKSLRSRANYLVRNPKELLRAWEDIVGSTEQAQRLNIYKAYKDSFIKEGKSVADAERLAAKGAREVTTNFRRSGEANRALLGMYMYLNASVQGSRTLARAFKKNPAKVATKVATFVLMPEAMLTAWNVGDEKRKALYEQVAPYERENNFIFIPDTAKYNTETQRVEGVIKMPKPPGISQLAIPVRRFVEQLNGLDPVAFKDLYDGLVGAVSPIGTTQNEVVSNLVPQAIKPALEVVTNKNLYTGRDIIPQSMEQRSPENQVKDTTSGTARIVGKVFNTSPLDIEQLVRGYFGTAGPVALNIIDKMLATGDIIPDDQVGGKDVIKSIADRFIGAAGGEKDRKIGMKLDEGLVEQNDKKYVESTKAEVLYKAFNDISPTERKEKLRELAKKDPEMAKMVIEIKKQNDLGLTINDRKLLRFGVENGFRARYIMQELEGLSNQEQKDYLRQLARKKIVTEQVLRQLVQLKQKP